MGEADGLETKDKRAVPKERNGMVKDGTGDNNGAVPLVVSKVMNEIDGKEPNMTNEVERNGMVNDGTGIIYGVVPQVVSKERNETNEGSLFLKQYVLRVIQQQNRDSMFIQRVTEKSTHLFNKYNR